MNGDVIRIESLCVCDHLFTIAWDNENLEWVVKNGKDCNDRHDNDIDTWRR